MREIVKLTLPQGWVNVPADDSDGCATFLRESSECPGPLQISHLVYMDGELPCPSVQDLIEETSIRWGGEDNGFGDAVESYGGDCALGRFGTTVFRSEEYPRSQVWLLSNGKDKVLVTHLCPDAPGPQEVAEVDQIVRTLAVGPPDKPWWKFW